MDELKLNRKQIEISGGRTMNIYTFEVDGVEVQEMKKEDVIETVPAAEQARG